MRVLACLLCSGLIAQAPAFTPGATQSMKDEIARVNALSSPDRSWLAGEGGSILVIAKGDMSWKMQSAMLFKAGAAKYRAEGIAVMIVFNGKRAWTRSTAEGADTQDLVGPVPLPEEPTEAMAQWIASAKAYNAHLTK